MTRLILVLSVCVSSCKVTEKATNKVQPSNLKIDFELHNCVDIYKNNISVTFVVHNDANVGFWIDSWNFFLDSIIDKNGEIVSSKSIVEPRHPKIPQYYWVDANSSVKIPFPTDYFLRADLKKLQQYYVYTSYGKGAKPKKNSVESTLIKFANLEPKSFWTCF